MKPFTFYNRSSGFSLVEVLLATFILAIGLIMVATIFPVGADWTRQATEANVGQLVAQNAMNIIKERYSVGGNLYGQTAALTTTDIRALPGVTAIPISERTYQFGNSSPFPARNPAGCTYYWTALARVSPAQATSLTPTYDLYIVVFRKGEAAQTFADNATNEVAGVRDSGDLVNPFAFNHLLEPTLWRVNYDPGTYDKTLDPPIANAVPALGFTGIGVTSGTVFRQVVVLDVNTPSNSKAVGRPYLLGQTTGSSSAGEQIIYAPHSDGTTASPLVYVYQTTLTF